MPLWFSDFASVKSQYFDLPFHGETKEEDKIDHQDRPEYGDVENVEKWHDKRHDGRFRCRDPKLEFRQSSNEGPKFLIRPCGQIHVTIFWKREENTN